MPWAEVSSHNSTPLSRELRGVHSMKPAVTHHQRLLSGIIPHVGTCLTAPHMSAYRRSIE